MARRKQGGFELIASAPWPVGVVLGIIAFVGVRYGISWYLSTSGNQFLVPIGKAANGSAITFFASARLGMRSVAACATSTAGLQRGRLLETRTCCGMLRGTN